MRTDQEVSVPVSIGDTTVGRFVMPLILEADNTGVIRVSAGEPRLEPHDLPQKLVTVINNFRGKLPVSEEDWAKDTEWELRASDGMYEPDDEDQGQDEESRSRTVARNLAKIHYRLYIESAANRDQGRAVTADNVYLRWDQLDEFAQEAFVDSFESLIDDQRIKPLGLYVR